MTTPSPSSEHEKLARDVLNAMDTLTNAVKTKNHETEANVRAFFERYEDEAQKYARALQMHKQGFNVALNPPVSPFARTSPEYKTFFNHITCSTEGTARLHEITAKEWAINELDHKTLRSDQESTGGYLIPKIMDDQIRRNITEMSPVRLFARNRVLAGKMIEVPRRLTIPTAAYEGEGEASPTDQSSYGSEQVTAYRQTVTIPATMDMMISSAFDLEQELAMDVGEALGKNEGQNFLNGLGIKGPQGILKDSRVEVVPTGTTGQIDWSDLNNVASKLKSGQNPWFFFNRRTLGYLQGIKSSIGVPIWAPVAGDKPATIWGYPYSSDFIDLPDAQAGSGSKSIIFGDLRRGYEVHDVRGISVVRDDLTRKREAITEWTFRRYNTGRVIIPEAIKVLVVA